MRKWIYKIAGLAMIVLASRLTAMEIGAVDYQDVTKIVFSGGSVPVKIDTKSNSLAFAVSGAAAMRFERNNLVSRRFMWGEPGDGSFQTVQLLCDCVVWVKTNETSTTVSILNAASHSVNHSEIGFGLDLAKSSYDTKFGPLRFRKIFGNVETGIPTSQIENGPLAADLPMTYGRQKTDIVAQKMLNSLQTDKPSYDSAKYFQPITLQKQSSQMVVRGDIFLQSRAMPEVEESASALVSGCAEYRHASPREWPATQTALSLIADARNAIGRENGEMDGGESAAIVKAYLSLGMGAEASQFLAISDFTENEKPIIEAIAREIDGQESDFGGASGQVDVCPSASIWVVLQGRTSAKSALDLARVQFAQAPIGVQAAIGARLAARFLEGGDRDAAFFVLKSIKGLPEQQTGERDLVVGRLEKTEGYAKQSAKALAEITRTDEDVAPDALLDMVKNALDDGEPIAPRKEQLLDTYRAERQGTDLEKDLMRAQLQARTNRGDFSDVIGMLPDFERIARPSQVDLAIDDLAGAVLKDSSDAVFLTTIMDLPKAYLRRVSESQRQDINRRFTSLGLEGLARELWSEIYNPKVAEHSNSEAAKPMENPRIEVPQTSETVDTQKSDPGSQVASNAIRQQPVETSTSQGQVRKEQRLSPVQKPLAEAVDRSSAVLDTLPDLKAEIANLKLK